MEPKKILRILVAIVLISCSLENGFAQSLYSGSKVYDIDAEFTPHQQQAWVYTDPRNKLSPVEKRAENEKQVLPDYFSILPYMPNYILPYYFTGSPYNSVYQNNTPNNEQLDHSEVKFQLSLKVPLYRNTRKHSTSVYFAYTQLSYWQVYNQYAFFRETDYQPEVFVANQIDYPLSKCWHFDFLNVGAVHQSNGFGNDMERTWNRLYLEGIMSNDNWMLSIKPWWIITNGSLHKYNPNIATFLGYGRVLIAYKHNSQVFSLEAHNFIEGHAKSATGLLTWSFPLTKYLKGYAQVFSGYGQSLIEYDHRTNSAGVGFALTDWI